MKTLQTLTRDAISERLRAWQKVWHLRPLLCSAHNTSESKDSFAVVSPELVGWGVYSLKLYVRTVSWHTYEIYFLRLTSVVGTIA